MFIYSTIFCVCIYSMCPSPGLTLKVLVTTIDAQWEGMVDVGSARYEPVLLPPCQTIRVLSYSSLTSNFQKFSTLWVNRRHDLAV